ncbi:MAG: IS256 family transposase [Proteobacteria bacterium]|jgi:transposase-like protein|nr:IS256 family transposase [Pseudomonadota bacterium]
MKKSVSKKMKEVIEKHMGEMNHVSSIMELTHTGARMMLQIAIEEELKAFIGRDYYERRTDNQKGLRSGFKPRTIKTGCGDIEIEMPQVRNTDIPFHSQLLPPYLTRIKEIEETIPLLYMHGLSTRKVKKAVGKLLGTRGLSHQNVIKISKKIVVEFNAWKKRDLSQTPVLYLILDGIRLGVRKNTTEKEAILIAWGFLEDGSRELIGVSLGNKESYSSWKYFLDDLIQRGLNEPLLTVIDGCPGLIKAVDEVFPTSDIQRCTKHKTENILDKVLKSDKDNVKDSIRKIFYASTYEHALEAINLFKKDWGKKYPSALECLLDDIESCLTYYKYPYTHRKRIRTTNVAERSFCEVKRRTRTIGRFQEETRALTMVWWQLKELNWYGVVMTHEAKTILDNIRASKYAKAA